VTVSGETTIGVFGETMLLWIIVLRQSPRRPPAEHVLRQANYMLDELKASPAAQALPVQSVDDGMFAVAVLLDEVAMSLPDLRQLWGSRPLQATRWTTNNAGVEFFERMERARHGPRSVLATYVTVLGCGFQGKFGLPGMSKDPLMEIRRQVQRDLRVDADRDVLTGVLRPIKYDELPSEILPRDPWYKSVWMGRALAGLTLLGGGVAAGLAVYSMLGLDK
jgi:type VI secretion system protein ImpK